MGHSFVVRFVPTIILAVLSVFPAVPSFADSDSIWRHVNVTSVDGETLTDVTVAWGLAGFSLKVTAPDGREIGFSPAQVAMITDSEGNDITNIVAAASPASTVKFALLGDERSTPMHFTVMAAAGGTAGLLKGAGDFEPVGAFHAGARVRICSWSHLHVLYRRQQIGESVIHGDGDVSTSSNEVHILLGSRMTHPRRNNNYTYLEAGVALVKYTRRFNEDLTIVDELPDWRSGFSFRGGAVLPLTEHIGLDLGAILMTRPSLIENSMEPDILIGLNVAVAVFGR